MQCKCIDEITAKLKQHAVEKLGAINPSLSMNNLGINFNTGEGVISLPFTIRAENKPFNTLKGKSINMVASFCPFCGKSAKAVPVPPVAEAA